MKQDIVNEALKERFLLQKEYLGDNKLVNQINPLVSITVATYQHVDYIKQCLDGILMQKTNFLYEVIIGEDGSIDGTQEICKEYARKYPDKIRLFIRDRNLSQFVTDNSEVIRFNGIWNRMSARGKYIAWCEGDDYWTDPYKLQKQVDFLESHPDYVVCSHRYQVYEQKIKRFTSILPIINHKEGDDFLMTDLIQGKWLIQPLCMVYRKSVLENERLKRYRYVIDTVFVYNMLTQGKAFCFSDVMGVYRIQEKGIWSGIDSNEKIFLQLKATKAIYDVERSAEAARFLLFQFSKPISRIWLLKNIKRVKPMLDNLAEFYGLGFVVKLLSKKILLNKNANL